MKPYLDLVEKVLDEGEVREDRTGVGTLSIFGAQCKYDLREGFPLLTAKKTYFTSVVKELLWILRAETNIKTLGCGIWDAWADKNGELGPIYGAQWRRFKNQSREGLEIDQISKLIKELKENPFSRRHIVTAWNPSDLDDMALPPCHTLFQFYASEVPKEGGAEAKKEYYLDLQLYQRSADLLLGVPFNIASYSLLLMLIAREVNMIPRFFIHTVGDVHIYKNHIEGAKEMLSRDPRSLPEVIIEDKPIPYPGCPRDGSVLEPDDFKLVGYNPHPFIKLEVAV